jgi:hypothetical protein
MGPEKERSEDLPQPLIEALKSAHRPVPMITARVDREISEMARRHFSVLRRPTRVPRPAWTAMVAMAATVLIAVFVVQLQPPNPDQSALYTDIDRSGRIDIADVLALARAQEPGERSQAELDAFASRIVSLKRAGEAS